MSIKGTFIGGLTGVVLVRKILAERKGSEKKILRLFFRLIEPKFDDSSGFLLHLRILDEKVLNLCD